MTIFAADGSYLIGGGILLATKANRPLTNITKLERAPESLAEGTRAIEGVYKTAVRRCLGATYNCLGLVFSGRRTWVEPEHWEQIRREDKYRPVSLNAVVPGDIVIYKNEYHEMSHVGIVVCIKPLIKEGTFEITVLSKWGQHGEYFHRVDDVSPALGTPVEYWTERA